MYAPLFELRAFDSINDRAKGVVLIHLLEGLIAADVAYLIDNPKTPWLYESGVVYEEEPEGRDNWQDIPRTIELRVGDCEDLGCWRVAELRVRTREHAKPIIRTLGRELEAPGSIAARRRRMDVSKGRGWAPTTVAVADALRETRASGLATPARRDRARRTSTRSSVASPLTPPIDADKTRSPPACKRARGSRFAGDPAHHHSLHLPAQRGRRGPKFGAASPGDCQDL